MKQRSQKHAGSPYERIRHPLIEITPHICIRTNERNQMSCGISNQSMNNTPFDTYSYTYSL